MKSNPSIFNPAKQDFIAIAISSTEGGFHPSQTDLTAGYSFKSVPQNGRGIFLHIGLTKRKNVAIIVKKQR